MASTEFVASPSSAGLLAFLARVLARIDGGEVHLGELAGLVDGELPTTRRLGLRRSPVGVPYRSMNTLRPASVTYAGSLPETCRALRSRGIRAWRPRLRSW